jgi:hypothetical protein
MRCYLHWREPSVGSSPSWDVGRPCKRLSEYESEYAIAYAEEQKNKLTIQGILSEGIVKLSMGERLQSETCQRRNTSSKEISDQTI